MKQLSGGHSVRKVNNFVSAAIILLFQCLKLHEWVEKNLNWLAQIQCEDNSSLSPKFCDFLLLSIEDLENKYASTIDQQEEKRNELVLSVAIIKYFISLLQRVII